MPPSEPSSFDVLQSKLAFQRFAEGRGHAFQALARRPAWCHAAPPPPMKNLVLMMLMVSSVASAEPWHAEIGGTLGPSFGDARSGLDLTLHGSVFFRGLVDDGATPYGALAFYQQLTEHDVDLGVFSLSAQARGSVGVTFFPWHKTAFIAQVNSLRETGTLPFLYPSLDLGALTYFTEDFEGELWSRTGRGKEVPLGPYENEPYGPLRSFYEERLHAGVNAFLAHRHLRLSGSLEGALLFADGEMSGSQVEASFAATVFVGRAWSLALGIFEDHLQALNRAAAVTSTGWVVDRDTRSDTFGASANIRWFVTRAF